MRVAFLGPAGTFTDEALRASAPGEVEAVELPTVHELAGEAQDVRVAADLVHPISHCLVAARPLELGDVERVVSHPQATAQCAAFLRERLPAADRVDVGSTAEAVRQVVATDGAWAALASRLAAELYGAEGPLKTSIVFWGAGDETPGWLVRVLGELAEREVNLTRIESRPRRVRLGHYMFFCDLEGGESEPAVAEALEAVAGHVEAVRVLGCYPGVSRVAGR